MYERSFWDSFDGHAGERLAAAVPLFPLVGLGFTPIVLATMMTNALGGSLRTCAGVPAATKWMTLKWRVILLTIALITLLNFNSSNWDSLNLFEYTLFERFLESLTVEEPDEFVSFLFFLLMFLLMLHLF